MSNEITAVPGTLLRVSTVLGNLGDPEWSSRSGSARVEHLVLDQWEAQKSRLRRTTDAGTEVAISLERGVQLRDGDVLVWDGNADAMVVARIELKEVMEVEVGELLTAAPEIIVQTCVELGHAIGNQHWPAVVKGTKIYVPLTVDQKVMASVMRTHAFEGIEYTFRPGAEIIPYLAPHEARRLFGAAARDGEGHTHATPAG